MAKELPYFKFEPGQWDSGNIQLCSLEARGAFINICSLYWQRLGDLPYKLAIQKACNGNATALQSLCEEGVVKVIDDLICIDFLNEQLSEFEGVSKTNSENARSGWEKRRKNATALRNEGDRNASRGEESRGEEKKKEKKRRALPAVAVPFVGEVLKVWNEWEQFKKEKRQTLTPSSIKKQIKFLGGRGDPEIIAIINQSIMNGYTGLFELKMQGNGNRNGDTKTSRRADAIIEPGKDFGTF